MALHFPRAMPALPQAVPLVVMLSRGCYICYILPSAPSAFGAVNCFAVASARTAWGHQSLAACLAGKALSGAYSSCYYDLTNYSSATWISFGRTYTESAHVQGPLKLPKFWSLGHKIWKSQLQHLILKVAAVCNPHFTQPLARSKKFLNQNAQLPAV